MIKSHGGANVEAFQFAIEQAMLQARNNVVELVRDQIAEFMNQGLLL